MPNVIRNIQSGYDADDFWTNYGSSTPRVCVLVKVIPLDRWGGESNALGFTSNTRNMTMPEHSIVFKSKVGISPSNIEITLNEATNLEFSGLYQDDAFTREDVLAGKWNGARVEIMVVCWDNVNLGEWLVASLSLGEFKDYESAFTVEARGDLSLLANQPNFVTSKLCRRREFGNATANGCGVDLEGTITVEGDDFDLTTVMTVSAVVSDTEIHFSGSPDFPSWFFTSGKMQGTGGANGEVSREIESATASSGTLTVFLKRKFPFPVVVGQTYTMVAGCDRTRTACVRWGNVVNAWFENDIPGIEKLSVVR